MISHRGNVGNRFGAAMRHWVWVAFILIVANIPTWAQDCEFGGEEAFNALVKALSSAPSCKAAAAKLLQCAWGSSADTQFAPIVVAQCEKMFFDKLSPQAKKRYEDEMQLCAYRYARQEGTMYMSAAALCQVDVAAHFAASPASAGQPAPRASFDCGKAQTPLEKAICSDRSLGHADIVLARVYSGRLKYAKQDRSALVENEKQWLQSLPAKCGLSAVPLPQSSLDCVRYEFELRFTMLDGCIDKIADCLQAQIDEEKRESATASSSKVRASFDCEAPATALEIVICADAELGQTDIKLAQAYHDADKAMAERHKDLVDSQRQWLRSVNSTCPMGIVGGIPSLLARSCVRDLLEKRIAQLQTCPQKEQQERVSCLDDFKGLDEK